MDLPWLLFIIPLASAAIIQLGLKRSATASAWLSTGSVIATFTIAYALLGNEKIAQFEWIKIGKSLDLSIGYQLDSLSTGMMIVVTGIGMLVHIFSLGYMKKDEAKARYFSSLSLFMFSMTGIVLANNFVMMFIFWELVGLSSYLLIGHWYHKNSAADAAKKAFLANRIGDFGFMIGILMLWGLMGTVVFADMDGALFKTISSGVAAAIILLLFCGAIGKSAQLPLHIWLPDAMEGPTPVSALIHAATMVAAGVYMMARLFLSLGITPENASNLISYAPEFITYIGGFTSLVAALMATQQNDIKKILAYSTLSQLGYMIMAIGLVSPEAGMFHLYTHAWFKALLFLGSGAIIYACHHEQDIWKMGGLFKKMPLTSLSFMAGTLALTAVPFTSGFYSKEGILHAAHTAHSPFLYIALLVAALTTFYMFRLFFVVFTGKPRDKGAEHAKEVTPVMLTPLLVLAIMAFASPFITKIFPGEVPHFDAIPHFDDPIVLLSLGAFVIGFLAALFLYKGKDSDPINISVFRDKFYFDELYQQIVAIGQDAIAAIIAFCDEFIIGTLIVGGASRSATGLGNLFRRYAQSGSLNSYAFCMGIGILLVIYFTVFA